MSPRARPLPVEVRRRQILHSVEPLIARHGAQVTTRQLAEAAGLAEGTVFRVFGTKTELLREVVMTALDPAQVCDRIDAIDLADPLSHRIAEVVWILHAQIERVSPLLPLLRDLTTDADAAAQQAAMVEFRERGLLVIAAIAEVLRPDAANLRLSLESTAHFLQAAAMATGHPMFKPAATPEAMIEVILHGVLDEKKAN